MPGLLKRYRAGDSVGISPPTAVITARSWAGLSVPSKALAAGENVAIHPMVRLEGPGFALKLMCCSE